MAADKVGEDAVRTALDLVDWPHEECSISDITEVENGINGVFVFATGMDNPARAVCKFATFSKPKAFQAGVVASQKIAERTAIPVPDVYRFRATPEDLPPLQIIEFLSGDPLPGHPAPENTGPARALGRVIGELDSVPADQTSGYGWIEADGVETTADLGGSDRIVEGEYDSCSEWLLQYGLNLYDDLPAHDRLAAVAAAVPSYLRENSHRFPEQPHRSVVLTDFGPKNLLARDGTVSDEGSLTELSGLVDTERAKLGPVEFNAVNAEFLMQRWIDDPEPVVEALYDPLPFGPDLPRRDLYRLLAMGREVGGLDLYYEKGGEKHERRGQKLADRIEQVVG